MTSAITVWTIGHGNRSLDEFIALLRGAGISLLVDVRAWPASRRHPHFARGALEPALAEAGLSYAWEGKALGGRRTPGPASPHVALANLQFRAYADHMRTALFREALERLILRAGEEPTAFMCAERLPSECHRSLVSDALVMKGLAVRHILTAGIEEPHAVNARARLTPDGLVYDAGTQLAFDA